MKVIVYERVFVDEDIQRLLIQPEHFADIKVEKTIKEAKKFYLSLCELCSYVSFGQWQEFAMTSSGGDINGKYRYSLFKIDNAINNVAKIKQLLEEIEERGKKRKRKQKI